MDRAAIFALVALRCLTPLWHLLSRLHVRLPSPLRLIGRYRIRDGALTWDVQGVEGAAYLFPATAVGHAYGALESRIAGVVLDIGAGFGWYTVQWATMLGTGGRVFALEPCARHLPSLERNTASLRNVTILSCAAGEHDGVVTLHDATFGGIYDASIRSDSGATSTVRVRRVDSLCHELGIQGVRFVKIDVEGYEPEVLRGMRQLLERDRPLVAFEALSPEALEACRAALPASYAVRCLAGDDYAAEPNTVEPA
jgi:FkbM family methyltransferase